MQHLVPPLGFFYHVVSMAEFGFGLLVLHYVVLEKFFSFHLARYSRNNSALSHLPTPSSSTVTPIERVVK